ncbi:MAG TPA: hypothetical protein VG939_08720 [Caulobacteraceae bacterium]|nr:hypothetical protein [Caulobacteraceae bacterium]
MTGAASLAVAALLLAGTAQAATPAACAAPAAPPPLPPDLVAAAARPHPWPTFCGIPAIPHDIRPATAWKGDVVGLRETGQALVRASDESTFTLNGTDAFAAEARREAAPPPQITSPEGDTEAFVNSAKARATPPPRPR